MERSRDYKDGYEAGSSYASYDYVDLTNETKEFRAGFDRGRCDALRDPPDTVFGAVCGGCGCGCICAAIPFIFYGVPWRAAICIWVIATTIIYVFEYRAKKRKNKKKAT